MTRGGVGGTWYMVHHVMSHVDVEVHPHATRWGRVGYILMPHVEHILIIIHIYTFSCHAWGTWSCHTLGRVGTLMSHVGCIIMPHTRNSKFKIQKFKMVIRGVGAGGGEASSGKARERGIEPPNWRYHPP